MNPETVKAIRQRACLTLNGLAAILRLADNGKRTTMRWEAGEVPISGPASIVLEMLDAGELPERYLRP
jgi:DNA-binding transcriptional regulator YiaG